MTYPATGRAAHTQRQLPGAPAPRAGRDDSAGATVEPGTARIAVDLLGGDNAPAVVVDGALRAYRADPDLRLLLVGPAEVADEVIRALPSADRARVGVRVVTDVVGMSDEPARASRTTTTVRAAVAAVTDGHADALVSAGASGATVTAAALGFGRWPGVRRPALAAVVPAIAGPVVLLDVGASVDATPATLARHAVLGAAYAGVAHGVGAPRVGLLSIGTEPGKGDRQRRAAEPVLTALHLPHDAHYVGLVEGHDVSTGGRADVVVADGFTGNVLLKGIEGAYALAVATPHTAVNPRAVAPRAAALLGVSGTVVICHGAATGEDVASGIALAAHLHRRGVVAAMATLIDVPARPPR